MNLIEFSIACKLISSKLKNVEVPKQLPPTLIASLQHIGTPIRTPTGAMSPTESYKQFLTQQPAQVVPMTVQAPILPPQPQVQPMMMSQGMVTANVVPQQPMMIPQQQQQILMQQQPIAQAIPQQMMQMPPQQIVQPIQQQIQPQMMQTVIPQAMPVYAAPAPMPLEHQLSNSSLLENLNQVQQPVVAATLPAAPTPTPPQSGHASRSMSFSEKAPSIPESPSMEWAIPQSSKLKYTQMFNAADKLRQGFLTGTQARGILLQTNVPQSNLAKIWAMSDRDSDGRLGCEEFVLALYLCEMFVTGKPVPAELPPELIPPSFRKLPSRAGSLAGSRAGSQAGSRHGSVSSQGGAAGDMDPTAGMPNCEF